MSTRMVYCVSITDKTKKYPDELCDVSSRPINEKNCSSDVLCPPMWHASQWSKVRQDGVAAFTWASLCFDFPFIQLSEKMPKHVYCQSAGALTIWTENLVIPEFKWYGSLPEPGFLARESENFTSTHSIPYFLFSVRKNTSTTFHGKFSL